MNDRYLFKAKRIDWQEWIKECQWFQGNLITIGERYYLAQCRNNSNELWIGEWVEIDTSTLCQCTGLKDKAGILIWENDVVKIPAFTPHYMSIKFIEGAFCLGNSKGEYVADIHYIHSAGRNETEVVDNIFDNPELLEVE